MDAITILDALHKLSVEIVADGDQLRFRPRSAVSPEMWAAMAQSKPDLLRVLGGELGTSGGRLKPTPAAIPVPRQAVKRALVLALAEGHDWSSLPLKPGISAGGTERMWRTFVRYADASVLTLAVQTMPHVWADAPIIADLSPAESADVSCMTVDNVFERLRDRGGGLYVDDDRLHYVGPRPGADDPLWQAFAVHHDELLDLFTCAPNRRCVFTDCHRLVAPDDRVACLFHRLQMDVTPMPWDAQAPTSEVQ